MQQPPIRLYTSSLPAARAFAECLADNLSKPVAVQPLSQLPAPDRLRRQQLRTERAGLLHQLRQDRNLLTLASPHAGIFPQEVADIEAGVERTEQRLREINALLGEEGGHPHG